MSAKRVVMLVALLGGGCAGQRADAVTPPTGGGGNSKTPGATMTGSEDLLAALNFDGTGPWFRFLQSGDADMLANRLSSRINQGQTMVLRPGMQQVERVEPEARKHITAPALAKDAGGRITLTFWYGMAPGFGPNHLSASAAADGAATVKQTPLQSFVPETDRV